MTNFAATIETAAMPIEAVAVAARRLFEVLHPTESWDELSGLADQQKTPALARQAVFMRAARFGLDGYARFAANIRHRNPLSQGERTKVAQVWQSIVSDPKPVALRNAAKLAAVHISRYDVPLSQTVAAGGHGAVSAMIREYSMVLVRLSTPAD